MQRPIKQTELVIHPLDEELLIYDPDADRSHRLNRSATFIWQHCDGNHSSEKIARLLTEQFEVDLAVARRDTNQAIDQMLEQNIVSCAVHEKSVDAP